MLLAKCWPTTKRKPTRRLTRSTWWRRSPRATPKCRARVAGYETERRYVRAEAVLDRIVQLFGRDSHEGQTARDRLKVYRQRPADPRRDAC